MKRIHVFGLVACMGGLFPLIQTRAPDEFPDDPAVFGVVTLLFGLLTIPFAPWVLKFVSDPELPLRKLTRLAYHLMHAVVAPLFLGAAISSLIALVWTRGTFHWGYVLANAGYFIAYQFGLRPFGEPPRLPPADY